MLFQVQLRGIEVTKLVFLKIGRFRIKKQGILFVGFRLVVQRKHGLPFDKIVHHIKEKSLLLQMCVVVYTTNILFCNSVCP